MKPCLAARANGFFDDRCGDERCRDAWSDLAAIGVGTGPGNFTGIRIGVAAARGLALGLGVPAIGIDRFSALALDGPDLPAVLAAPRGLAWMARPGAVPEQIDPAKPCSACDRCDPASFPRFAFIAPPCLSAVAIARLASPSPRSRSRALPRSTCVQPTPRPRWIRAPRRFSTDPMTPWALAALHARCFEPPLALERRQLRRACYEAQGSHSLPPGHSAFALVRIVADEAELLTIATDPDL
jgi:hypothetical protein